MDMEKVWKEEDTYLEKVAKEKVPCHARVYPMYSPIMIRDIGKEVIILYGEDALKEIDEKTPIAEIRRANAINVLDADKQLDVEERFKGQVVDHRMYNMFINAMKSEIHVKKVGIKDFKIFHIWNISLNMKQSSLRWSAKFQHARKKIELEIHSHEENENEIGLTKVVNFPINDRVCDQRVIARVDNYMVDYSLLSNAFRVKFEIRPYNADGSPARDVNGYILASFDVGGKKYEQYLLGGNNKYEKAANDTCICFDFILSRDICCFKLDTLLNDETGKFVVKEDVQIRRRSVAIDEQHYIVGRKGYIILTTIWACLCVDLEQGICTCPGTAIGTFPAENNDSGEDTEDEDSIEGRTKRVKIRQSSSTSQETTGGEGSNSSEDSISSTS